MKKILKVTGMSCASCSAHVEKSVGKIDGVERAVVNLAAERIEIVFDPVKTSLDAIKEAIEKAEIGRAHV